MYKKMKHQEYMTDLLLEHDQFALFAQQGTGKTIPMLEHVIFLLSSGLAENALIVAPIAAIGSWFRDLEKFPKYKQDIFNEKVIVINYEKVWRRSEHYKHYDIIVLDEAHAISGRNSTQAKFFIGERKGRKIYGGANRDSKYRYILTGTPKSNAKLEQYYALIEFLEPDIFGSYANFKREYCVERNISGLVVPIITGYRNKKKLMEIIGERSIRLLKSDCNELPEKLDDEVIKVPLKSRKIYNNAKNSFIKELVYNIPNPMTKIGKLRQICSGHVTGDTKGDLLVVPHEKLKYLESLISMCSDSKICIFANYTFSITEIQKLLNDLNIRYLTLDGTQKDKTIWTKFQKDEKIRIIICQYKTANSGIDLYASDTMIFYEPPISTTIMEQAKDRIHRTGQTSKCSYYWLITENTIEEDIYEGLVKNADFNNDFLLKVQQKYNKQKEAKK